MKDEVTMVERKCAVGLVMMDVSRINAANRMNVDGSGERFIVVCI